ncbi:hypothetical protein IU436_11755 [Nocardia farcinica]|uniref:DUF6764 family protein n=1 Tax=Nocardia farcinica TaxID=37329 RepID=UPI001893FBAD|nr:DUF6764 family protein [Nocardia farcinica]MBF6270880.1 hypothetical protein [Nocardia farcinica]MBF6372228.1 hypothetical protein [Nocardia farcinica]MBF6419549.1 hypothetical protein [Nocardia farcinica]MBF6431026.1 hypothetical protein [Nocardia farcinica]MBF6501540.1 hypothetical protein [Nocardia farcinica]
MNLISVILCSTAAVGGSLMIPGVASATSVHCTAEGGADITVIEGSTGCRAASDAAGHARSAGYDGVGYARASQGAAALGVGAAGGVGASEGTGGIPIAVGVGPDAMALSMIAADPAAGPAMAVAIAFQGSRAEVGGTPDGSVVCLGSGAIAWNMQSGATCLTTPFGSWKPTLPVTAADRS